MKKSEVLVPVLLRVFGKVHSPLYALVQLPLETLQALTFFEIVLFLTETSKSMSRFIQLVTYRRHDSTECMLLLLKIC